MSSYWVYTRFIKKKRGMNMDYEIVTLNEKTVVGYSACTSNSSSDMGQVIGGLWEHFFSEEGYFKIGNKVNDKTLGIYTDYTKEEKGEYTVVVACEVNSIEGVSDFVVRKIPAGKYAKFIVKGNMITAVAQFWQELWQLELDRSFLCDFEEYQNSDCENAEIHIYIGLK